MFYAGQLKSTDEDIIIARFGGMDMDASDWLLTGSMVSSIYQYAEQGAVRRGGFMPRANGCDGFENLTAADFGDIFG
ncbi:hypothetical protein [Azonexus sp.]|uniref:hypothetical protein n=1 Tax=Azonexus sp. TaxID=1872668 RepID=UPI0039E663B4